MKNTITQISFFLTLSLLLFSSSIIAQSSGIWEFINNGTSCSSSGTPGSCCQGRHEASYVQAGDKFYLLGGREHNSNVNIYDPATDSWTIGADAPHSVHHFQAVEYHGLILVVGAFQDNNYPNEQPLDKILIYDPTNDEWLDGPIIPENRRRGSAGVVVHNDKIYIVSGIQNGHKSGWVPWLDEYDPSTNTWRILPDAPHSRDHFHAALVDGKIYAGAGRRSGESGTFDATEGAVDIFDLSTETWTTNPNDIPTQRAGNTVAVLGNEVIYIGGERNAGAANDETEALNINTGNWRTLAPLNVGRHGSQAIVNNDNIWLASGSPNRGGGDSQVQERFYFDQAKNPILTGSTTSDLDAPASFEIINSTTETVSINNAGGNTAILIQDITIDNNNFQFNAFKTPPFILKSGESFDLEIAQAESGSFTSQIDITHTGTNGNSSIVVTTSSNENSFTPDPNKTYYLDVPRFNRRLAATGENEDAYTNSTTTTGADVEWKFVDKGNGYWHIQRAAGGSTPRLRTDNSPLADMQETTSRGVYTYYQFTNSSTSGTHYITLPDGPSEYQRLQMTPEDEIKFTTTNSKGTWVSWKITEVVPASRIVHIRKRNAIDYALDGRGGAADGQNVHLWSQNTSNVNQQWIEIDRGNGYFAYQKMGTNHCLDGGAGGAKRQNVYIWSCSENNQNQHWKKEDAGAGYVKLIKRNAPFAINGGSNGTNGQNVNLWSAETTSQNLNWLIQEIPDVTSRVMESSTTSDQNQLRQVVNVTVSPNPTEGEISINLYDFEDQAVDILITGLSGAVYLTEKLDSDHHPILNLDISAYRNGMYLLYIKPENQKAQVKKISLINSY